MKGTVSDNKILLSDMLKFDNLRKCFPDKRIKLRFNKNWPWEEDGKTYWHDYVQSYRDNGLEGEGFYEHLYSTYSNKTKRLRNNDIVFQFIEIGWHSWLLVDARVIIDTDGCAHKNGWVYAQAESLAEYEPYFGRLVVDWTNTGRNWFYTDSAIVDNIPIATVLPKTYIESAESFHGYETVCKTYIELKRIIGSPEWWSALSSIYGVYVITDRATGKHYVGSAYGDNGVAGRWSVYLNSGYDKDEKETDKYPNKKLKALVNKEGLTYVQNHFQYTLIEFYPMTESGKRKALERERYWKEALQTRGDFGYNNN